jgi:hypothetical protein
MPTLVSLNRLAAELRLPRNWLKQEAQAGRLPCLRIGRRLLFSVPAVEQVLADRAANPADQKRPE